MAYNSPKGSVYHWMELWIKDKTWNSLYLLCWLDARTSVMRCEGCGCEGGRVQVVMQWDLLMMRPRSDLPSGCWWPEKGGQSQDCPCLGRELGEETNLYARDNWFYHIKSGKELTNLRMVLIHWFPLKMCSVTLGLPLPSWKTPGPASVCPPQGTPCLWEGRDLPVECDDIVIVMVAWVKLGANSTCLALWAAESCQCRVRRERLHITIQTRLVKQICVNRGKDASKIKGTIEALTHMRVETYSLWKSVWMVL